MKIFAPDYYKDFKCIADKCMHSCCVGWEIDVDYDTFDFYSKTAGDFGKRLINSIDKTSEPPHFILSENERCPFLNERNLCDIIINMGEERLCQICSEHPRFRNFFSDREEMGLGMCCEAAAELILAQSKPFELKLKEDYGKAETEAESEFFLFRQKIFELLEEREKSIDKRIVNVLKLLGVDFPLKSFSCWAEVFKGLERLDREWDKELRLLEKAEKTSFEYDECINLAFENLLKYFIFRHTSEGIWDGRLKERISFCILSFYVIRAIFSLKEDKSFKNFSNLCRMYSAEVEYSRENIDRLLDCF